MTLHLSICGDCAVRSLKETHRALLSAGLPDAVEVKESACLGPCDRPSVMALQRRGDAGYVFAGIDMAKDAHDVVATCALYLDSDAGWIEDARPCGRLRHLLVARMPA